MKRKSILRTAGAAVLSALMLMTAVPVMAAGSNYGTTIDGTKTTTFDKYLLMDKDANVPNATFSYEVTAGVAQTYNVDGKAFEVLAGVDADQVTMAGVGTTEENKIAFTSMDQTSNTVNDAVKGFKDPDTQKYATKTATLDFSGVAFTEPGIYRYIITEEDSTNPGVTNDNESNRVLDVYVYDASTDTEKKLEIKSYVLHSATSSIVKGDGNEIKYSDADTKNQGFTNEYGTTNLTFRKEVSGNQASHDKYFAFTVKITGAVADTKYDVDLTNADATTGTNAATIPANQKQTNVAELIVGEDGTVTQVFYLQHGQDITIKGLATGTKYEVTENAEDYVSTPKGVEKYKDETSGTIADTSVRTSYLNTREGIIPTGIMMTVAPFAALTLAGGIGAASVVFKKRKKEDGEA